MQDLQRDLVPVDTFTSWQLLQLGQLVQLPVEDLGDDAVLGEQLDVVMRGETCGGRVSG